MKNDHNTTNTLKPITDGLVAAPSEVGFSIYGGNSMKENITMKTGASTNGGKFYRINGCKKE